MAVVELGGRTVPYCVYLLASRKHGTLVTSGSPMLVRRVGQHKTKATSGFTAKYGVGRLVWFKADADPTAAIAREKALKKWRRDWKIRLIEEQNPEWFDLFPRDLQLTVLSGLAPSAAATAHNPYPALRRNGSTFDRAGVRLPPRWSAARISAICTALSAAPLRRLSATTQKLRPYGTVGSRRMRLT